MDMVTLAMAKAYTDEKLGEVEPGGGGSQGKVVIDLDAYGITNALGGLFQSGGGEVYVDDVGDFWTINTEGTIEVSFSFFGMFKICTSNVTTIHAVGTGALAQLCFGFDIFYNGDMYRGAVMLVNQGSTKVVLKLEIESPQ